MLLEWQWGGMTLRAILPHQRPPGYGLYGVHCAGIGLVQAMMGHHGWTKGRVLRWVQWFLDGAVRRTYLTAALDGSRPPPPPVWGLPKHFGM